MELSPQPLSPPGDAPAAVDKPALQTRRLSREAAATLLLLFAAPLFALLLFEACARGSLFLALGWAAKMPLAFLLNYGLVASVFWLLAFFRGDRARSVLAIFLTVVLGAVGFGSFYKLRFRFEPALLTDLWQMSDLRTTVSRLGFPVNWTLAALLLVAGLSGLTLSCVFLRRVRKKHCLLWPGLGSVLFCLLLSGCTLASPVVGMQTDLMAYARIGGGMYTMLAAERQRQENMRYDYNESQVPGAYEKARLQTEKDAENTPNILFVLSESFTDQAHLGQYLDLRETLMPFYEELTKTCRTGEIYAPKMGGGTSETEFEVLTGLKSDYTFSPYSMGIPPLHSVAAVLRERGYAATALHWYAGVYYNRFKNLRELGFDEFYTTDTTTRNFQREGPYVSDAEHYRFALETMKQTPGKDFIFCITMQNHGPYTAEDFAATVGANTPFANSLSPESELIARNFCHLLRRSDAALKDFITALKGFQEPTLVVFFGDHVPGFGENFYRELGMPTEGDGAHLAPYFIWSNVENTVETADMKAWQLGAYALRVAGIQSDPFFRHIEALRQSGENEDDTYRLLSYDALLGPQRAYRLENFQIESPDWQIGGEMELEALETAEVDGAVYVLPILEKKDQAYELTVNGQLTPSGRVLLTDQPFTLQCVINNSNGNRFNQSREMTFSGTAELLAKTNRARSLALDLGDLSFQLLREEGGYLVVESEARMSAPLSSVTLNGKRLEWQRPYGFKGPGEYHLGKEDGPLRLTLSAKDFAGFDRTPQGIAAYLKDRNAMLIRFLPSQE